MWPSLWLQIQHKHKLSVCDLLLCLDTPSAQAESTLKTSASLRRSGSHVAKIFVNCHENFANGFAAQEGDKYMYFCSSSVFPARYLDKKT